MEKVTGIGGVFFRSSDPAALGKWYEAHLGVSLTPADFAALPWRQESGPTVWGPFPEKTEYFGDMSKQWMINFRVDFLDAMIAQLRAHGIKVTLDPEKYQNGRFARLVDPEGNPIELWEPSGRDAKRPP
jgi:glyoxylase I family protein